jgi:hypothetical protein
MTCRKMQVVRTIVNSGLPGKIFYRLERFAAIEEIHEEI